MSSSTKRTDSLRVTDRSTACIRGAHPEAYYIQERKEWDLRTNDERALAIVYHRSRIDRARQEGLFQDEHTEKGEIPSAFN